MYAEVERQTAATNTSHFLCSVRLHNAWKSGIWKEKKEAFFPIWSEDGSKVFSNTYNYHQHEVSATDSVAIFTWCWLNFTATWEDVPTITYAMELVHGLDLMPITDNNSNL